MPIRFAEPCIVCGRLYLHGTSSTCDSCLKNANSSSPRSHKPSRLRCDCGGWAVAVVVVRIGNDEDGFSEERLPLCEKCLEIEKKTQAMLDRLGYG